MIRTQEFQVALLHIKTIVPNRGKINKISLQIYLKSSSSEAEYVVNKNVNIVK